MLKLGDWCRHGHHMDVMELQVKPNGQTQCRSCAYLLKKGKVLPGKRGPASCKGEKLKKQRGCCHERVTSPGGRVYCPTCRVTQNALYYRNKEKIRCF